MALYRNRSIVVEAKQWWPPSDERHDPLMLVQRKGNSVEPGDYRRVGDLYLGFEGGVPGIGGEDVFMIRTLDGDLKVSPGDWIITGLQGEKYPCRPDIFEATYDIAECQKEASDGPPYTHRTTDVDIVVDGLSLVVDVPYPAIEPIVEGWTDVQRAEAFEWAMACHLSASDNDDVVVPDKPVQVEELEAGAKP